MANTNRGWVGRDKNSNMDKRTDRWTDSATSQGHDRTAKKWLKNWEPGLKKGKVKVFTIETPKNECQETNGFCLLGMRLKRGISASLWNPRKGQEMTWNSCICYGQITVPLGTVVAGFICNWSFCHQKPILSTQTGRQRQRHRQGHRQTQRHRHKWKTIERSQK